MQANPRIASKTKTVKVKRKKKEKSSKKEPKKKKKFVMHGLGLSSDSDDSSGSDKEESSSSSSASESSSSDDEEENESSSQSDSSEEPDRTNDMDVCPEKSDPITAQPEQTATWDKEKYKNPLDDPNLKLNIDWVSDLEGINSAAIEKDWEENREYLLNNVKKRLANLKKSRSEFEKKY